MRIALTGATGFIGRHFVPEAIQAGHSVVPLTRSPKETARQTDYSVASLAKVFDGCNAVVHLASERPSGEWTFEQYVANVGMTQNVLDASVLLRITNVVIMSSRSVYSIYNERPWRESSELIPMNLYGASKAAMETMGAHYSAFRGLHCKSLRLAQVLGWGEQGGYMMSTFLERALSGKPLMVHGRGEGKREYIYVRDVVSGILSALSHPAVNGIFNIGTGTTTSIFDLAHLVCEVFGASGNVERVPDAAEDVNTYVMDVERARRELHWTARYSVRDALVEMKRDLDQQQIRSTL